MLMDNKSIFNLTVCLIGVAILLIHVTDLILKKNKRKDELALIVFLSFTAIHFATYSIFTFIKVNHTSDALIMGFYTTFFIFNNIQLLLFYSYVRLYIDVSLKIKRITTIINLAIFAIFVILDIVNIFTRMFFTSIDGVYTRTKYMFFAQGYQFVAFAIVFLLTIFNQKLNRQEKTALSLYCFIPLVSIIVQNLLPGYAIAYLALIIAIEILFLFVSVKRNFIVIEEEKRNKEAEIKIMMSQIQPHFFYNSLASISTLIEIDPNKAQKALDDFTEYIRHNFSALTQTNLVPFDNELKHIKTYVNLEKVRFNERLKVNYDIKVNNFYLPPLSIQPLVENAIKHGILKRIDGGTLTLKTYENDKAYIVEIIDDGVGFDINNIDFKGNKHIGLNNIYHRIHTMTKGDVKISSEINKGTTVTVYFYKD